MKVFLNRFFVLVFAVSMLLQSGVQYAFAAQAFSYASLRLNRSAPNTAVSGFVCATPSSAGAGTEDSVTVTFPQSFSISATPSNWTVSTSGIPSGTTAWPGIGTATAVSGKSVTFPSNDLTNGATRYCFAYTGASSNTGSATGSQEGTIATKNSSNTTVDTSQVAVYVGTDQVTLNATVPASSTDFEADMTQTSPTSTTVNQNQTISYEVTYGSSLTYATDISVQASWSQGTIAGDSTPSLDIANYVIGSASTGYGGATPVIDTLNRTITWTISNFPANTTGETVTFQLETTDAFTGSQNVTFTVSGKVIGPGTETPPSTVTNTYQYVGTNTPTPTPTSAPGPTNSPTPGGANPSTTTTPAPTLSPTPAQNLRILDIELRSITATAARIQIDLSGPSPIDILYGESPERLTKKVTSLSTTAEHVIELTDLTVNTQYYFKVVLPNQKPLSDVFTFKTASSASGAATIDTETLLLISDNVVLFDPFDEQTQKNPTVVIPAGDPFQVKFGFNDSRKVKRVQLFIQNSRVLGISTFLKQADATGFNTNMIKLKNNEYAGRLRTPEEPGFYQLFAKIYDENGNLSEEKIVNIRSSRPLTILNDKGKPVEGAEVNLEYFDTSEKRFLPISSQSLAIQNPAYSDYKGIVHVTLPQAQYRASIHVFGYKNKTVIFTIGPGKDQDYPEIKLEKEPFSLLGLSKYYAQTFFDITGATALTIFAMTHSPRVFDFMALSMGVITLILLVIFILSKSYHKLQFIPGILARLRHSDKQTISGKIISSEAQALARATVHVMDSDNTLISTTYSGKGGTFSLPFNPSYSLHIIKEGFKEKDIAGGDISPDKTLVVTLETHESGVLAATKSFRHFVRSLFSMAFELLLVFCVLFELLILFVSNPLKTIPFVLLALFNLCLWVVYRRI